MAFEATTAPNKWGKKEVTEKIIKAILWNLKIYSATKNYKLVTPTYFLKSIWFMIWLKRQ